MTEHLEVKFMHASNNKYLWIHLGKRKNRTVSIDPVTGVPKVDHNFLHTSFRQRSL